MELDIFKLPSADGAREDHQGTQGKIDTLNGIYASLCLVVRVSMIIGPFPVNIIKHEYIYGKVFLRLFPNAHWYTLSFSFNLTIRPSLLLICFFFGGIEEPKFILSYTLG